MINEEKLVSIYARQLMVTNPKLTVEQAVVEVEQSLFGDPSAKAALLAITEAVWNDGYEARTFRLLTTEQRCRLANRNPAVPGVMHLIEHIERAILENNDRL